MNKVEVNSERWLSLEDFPGEEWRKVPIESKQSYYVSNFGRMKNSKIILRLYKSFHNYYRTKINRKWYYVHRIVAMTFLEDKSETMEIDHINGRRYDNRVTNLHWVTHIENMNTPRYLRKRRTRAAMEIAKNANRSNKLSKKRIILE